MRRAAPGDGQGQARCGRLGDVERVVGGAQRHQTGQRAQQGAQGADLRLGDGQRLAGGHQPLCVRRERPGQVAEMEDPGIEDAHRAGRATDREHRRAGVDAVAVGQAEAEHRVAVLTTQLAGERERLVEDHHAAYVLAGQDGHAATDRVAEQADRVLTEVGEAEGGATGVEQPVGPQLPGQLLQGEQLAAREVLAGQGAGDVGPVGAGLRPALAVAHPHRPELDGGGARHRRPWTVHVDLERQRGQVVLGLVVLGELAQQRTQLRLPRRALRHRRGARAGEDQSEGGAVLAVVVHGAAARARHPGDAVAGLQVERRAVGGRAGAPDLGRGAQRAAADLGDLGLPDAALGCVGLGALDGLRVEGLAEQVVRESFEQGHPIHSSSMRRVLRLRGRSW